MRHLKDKLALVTGAASGIGRAITLELVAADARLLLVDTDEVGLATLSAEARARGAEAATRVADLSQREAVLAVAEWARLQPGGIDILVNNAGSAYYGPTHEMSSSQFDRVLAVNLLAPITLTHALLPTLLERPCSHVLNVNSIAGLVGVAGLSAYNATKFALRGFSESLRSEYASLGLGVTTICPGLVRTKAFDAAFTPPGLQTPGFPRWIIYSPEQVARRAIRAVRRNEALVVVGAWPRIACWLIRLSPNLFTRLQGFRRVRHTYETPATDTCSQDRRLAA